MDNEPGRDQAETNADTWWWDGAMLALRQLAKRKRPFQAADIAALVGEPDHPCRWGALFAAAAKQRRIELAGYTESHRSGQPCRLWRGRG